MIIELRTKGWCHFEIAAFMVQRRREKTKNIFFSLKPDKDKAINIERIERIESLFMKKKCS